MEYDMLVIRLEEEPGPQVPPILQALGGRERLVHQVFLRGAHILIAQGTGTPAGLEARLAALPGVAEAKRITTQYLLSARQAFPTRTRVRLSADLELGGREFVVMAGPCAVEGREQMDQVAGAVAARGARVLRGGAYKPRTSPFCFQGMGSEGLDLLCAAGKASGLSTVSEVLDPRHLDEVADRADIVQVGMRNALNYTLLADIGRHPARPPVLLKCGIGTTVREFLCAADYILSGGNENVILCLRGQTGFGRTSRAVLNMADIPTLRRMTHLPIVIDPSHAAGCRNLVPALSAAALAAGADGLLVEVHPEPERALSDGPQSLTPAAFGRMMHRLGHLARAVGRTLATPSDTAPDAGGHPLEDLGMEGPDLDGRGA